MPRPDLAGASRPAPLTLTRVEREHALLTILAHRPEPSTASELAVRLGVSTRTVERDIERLRQAGIPLVARRGRQGGVRLEAAPGRRVVELEVVEIAALLSSLVALGPTATDLAASATRTLVEALEAAPD